MQEPKFMLDLFTKVFVKSLFIVKFSKFLDKAKIMGYQAH